MPNPFDLLSAIRQKKNPFRELTKEERKKQQKQEQEVKEGIKSLARVCEDILRDQRYAEFAALFKDIEGKLIDLLINCDEENRDTFYLKMKTYQIKLRMFKNILKMPHQFIQRDSEINRTTVK